MRRALLLSLALAGTTALMAAVPTPYAVSLKSGTLPAGVTAANRTGVLPAAEGYQRGWTADGWTVDRYGTHGYVAVSPTYTRTTDADGNPQPTTPCRNVLTLPELTLGEGCWLRWQALSAHPDFREAYEVTLTVGATGETVTLFSTDSENAAWTTRMADLSAYAGRDVTLSFVCTSDNRYLLALDAISVGRPEAVSIEATDLTPVYFGPQASAAVTVSALNTGAAIAAGTVEASVDGETVATTEVDGEWPTGARREFTLDVPLSLNRRTEYAVSFIPADGGEPVALSSKTIYSSDFPKKLVVDKGTGIWCVNCPSAVLVLESLHDRFGESLISLDTHVTSTTPASDVLANAPYFERLNFYAVPTMMLNRLKNSAATDARLFDNFCFKPAKFDLRIDGLTRRSDESLTASVSVTAAAATDNADDRYRIGYVATADFHSPDDIHFRQRNSSTQVTADRFYYLPSVIPAALCVYHNVTVTSDHAFDGFASSLPASIAAGAESRFSWSVDKPELVGSIDELRIVAFVLDTTTGEIMAADELRAADCGQSGIDDATASGGAPAVSIGSDGAIDIRLASPAGYAVEIHTPGGALAARFAGHADTQASIAHSLPRGIYIVSVTADGLTSRLKAAL